MTSRIILARSSSPLSVLDIVHTREVYVDEIGKSGHRVRQASVGEQLEQVAHTVATIERHPRSAKRRGSTPSVAWRVKSIPLWRSSSMWSASATSVPRPTEVELPGAGAASVVRLNHRLCCLLVREGETNLDELKYIDIGLRGGVVVLGQRLAQQLRTERAVHHVRRGAARPRRRKGSHR